MLTYMQYIHAHKPGLVKKLATLLIATVCILISWQSQASGNYHVEVIVFKQVDSRPGNRPDTFNTIPNFSSTWPSKTIYLNKYVNSMRFYQKYQILTHSAWGQKSASYNNSAAKQLAIAGMSGYIKVFAKQLLFADVKLNFEGHSISERRRLKLNEVHYFDNQGFGVLMRVTRI